MLSNALGSVGKVLDSRPPLCLKRPTQFFMEAGRANAAVMGGINNTTMLAGGSKVAGNVLVLFYLLMFECSPTWRKRWKVVKDHFKSSYPMFMSLCCFSLKATLL